jgi:hypothetical protein
MALRALRSSVRETTDLKHFKCDKDCIIRQL